MNQPPRPPPLATLAVGSLPHTQLELAMQQALSLDVLTLPQLPRCAPSEFMLPQALDGLPGLSSDGEGRTTVDPAAFSQGAPAFREKLERALRGEGLAAFEPTGTSCRAWRPFLWEIEQRRLPYAKAQLAGPFTARWATNLADGRALEEAPEIESQVVPLITARALAMAAAIRDRGATPLVFLDEPGLFAFDVRRPSHRVEIQELRFIATALRREGAVTGLHCCGNTDWETVLDLGFDCVAVDARLSLKPLLATGNALNSFLVRGGQIVLGIVPTGTAERVEPETLVSEALAAVGERQAALLGRTLLSPACGLATRTVAESQRIYGDLSTAQRLLRSLETE